MSAISNPTARHTSPWSEGETHAKTFDPVAEVAKRLQAASERMDAVGDGDAGGADEDEAWFEQHPEREFRLRAAAPGEKERFQRSFILVIRVPFGRVRTALFDHDLDLTAANTDEYCAGLLFKILSDPVTFVDFAKAWAAGAEAAKKLRQAEEKASGRASNSQATPKRKKKKRPQRKSRP